MPLLIVIWIVSAIIGASMAGNRNRSTVGWAIICGLTGVLGILVLALAGNAGATPQRAMRPLPRPPLHSASDGERAHTMRVANEQKEILARMRRALASNVRPDAADEQRARELSEELGRISERDYERITGRPASDVVLP